MRPRRYALGIIGWPVEHSLSPVLHHAALQAAGLEGEYRLYPLPDLSPGTPAWQILLERLRSGALNGLNVTIPHKQAVLPWLDELTPLARRAGAVNTLYRQDGRLVGDNTDVLGFAADFQRFAQIAGIDQPGNGHRRGKKAALLLGAGGAARAVICALAQMGWQVLIAARQPEQARRLAQDLGSIFPDCPPEALPVPLDALPPHPACAGVDLIVNATPLGMYPRVEASPWPVALPFPAGAAVYDLVYNPSQTRLVAAARAAGLPAATGLGMLVEQAGLSFERWTGAAASRPALFRAAEEALEHPDARFSSPAEAAPQLGEEHPVEISTQPGEKWISP